MQRIPVTTSKISKDQRPKLLDYVKLLSRTVLFLDATMFGISHLLAFSINGHVSSRIRNTRTAQLKRIFCRLSLLLHIRKKNKHRWVNV